MTHIEYVRQRLEGRDRILELADALCAEGLPRVEVAKILEGAAQQLRHEDHEELLNAERAAVPDGEACADEIASATAVVLPAKAQAEQGERALRLLGDSAGAGVRS
ncbi:MAG: hypothetical protein Q8S13_09815 [Dehalococcoidia bacterium]|nr:hypothetical protein [Dehalococcoidia bacterium]